MALHFFFENDLNVFPIEPVVNVTVWKICDKSRYERTACKRARLMTSHVNIYFCRRPLQNSPMENIATMSPFLPVSC